MNLESFREYCLSKKGVTESLPFGEGTLVFKVMDKVFALTGFDSQPLSFNIKCDPEKAIELREQHSCVLPGYHMNKKHWNTIIADGSVKDQLLQEWIDHSYELVVKALTKAKKEELAAVE
ncbi:MmcQ/YjbR family DNA-binding protein [Cytophagaceae bacterium DM2B3-1]|uniref:MmcQ/YjbR family DNA-binding protein n=1 Tax=Xanthocytophaga flava TaxID=3048013 RepID=A0ABT7CFH8_9BACT|nr:MmcQ/YjbR family DNA-binding protein [Xanthocytophaga flavus]MDJ1472265.1 MmcQ/YjbR family DNA-binding protein [Xanthocytophaga flavus]MDJ1492276.1 MmcQ/YjbR family DNA-binding protein [Xanthocytophaga flavus]